MQRLRVGLCLLPSEPWAVARRRWQAADELGYDHAWTYDHLVWRRLGDGPWFDGFTTLAAAASVTERIALGTLVTSPNLRHPAVLAKIAASLGDLSGGRVHLGIGAGSAGGDAHLLGEEHLTPAERMARLEEFVSVVVPLLTGAALDHEGAHYTVRDDGLRPAYVHAGRAPVLIAANGPRGMRLAATHGTGWVTDGGFYGLEERTPARFREQAVHLLARFVEAARTVGRDSTTVRRLVLAAPGAEPFTGDASAFLTACETYARAGFTDVVFHDPGPLGDDGRAIERIAERALTTAQDLEVATP